MALRILQSLTASQVTSTVVMPAPFGGMGVGGACAVCQAAPAVFGGVRSGRRRGRSGARGRPWARRPRSGVGGVFKGRVAPLGAWLLACCGPSLGRGVFVGDPGPAGP
jgi:hypothetical protein